MQPITQMTRASGFVDVDEMAAILKVPRSWLYAQTRRKGPDAIPVLRVGKYLRFLPPEVIGWLERRQES